MESGEQTVAGEGTGGCMYVQTRTTADCRRGGGGAGLHSDRGRGERGEGRTQQAIVADATLVLTEIAEWIEQIAVDVIG